MRYFLLVNLIIFVYDLQAQNTFPPTGNVGIGTTSVGNLLSVSQGVLTNNTISTVAGFEVRSNSNYVTGFGGRINFHITKYSNIHIGNDALAPVALNWWDAGSEVRKGMFAIATSNGDVEPTNRLVVDYNGNIGIGITTPGSKLDVQNRGDGASLIRLNTERPWDFLQTGTGANSSLALRSSVNSKNFIIESPLGIRNSIFNINDTPSLNRVILCAEGGNVGIGFMDPQYKLSVSGIISATEVKVSTTPNSDYVFEPDYNLLPLQDVESFIQQNKHLPDIPSSEEFKENGVGLGEMGDMLLRKIEELTLYMIQMKQEVEQLKAENKQLKQRILD
jgi:hypothetical protein